MRRILTGIVILIFGLLLNSQTVLATDGDILPKAGFSLFMADIYITPTSEDKQMPRYHLTEEDAELLLRVGVLEAGEKDVEGIANVMQVVMNRFESDEFPNTIPGVIFQRRQFTTASMLASANVTDESRDALRLVVWGDYKNNDSLYFESLPGKVWETKYTYTFSYGGHDFYR